LEAIQQVLHPSIQEFIIQNRDKKIEDLALKYKVINGVPIQLILQQIQGKQKSKLKLPSWYFASNIVFPPTLNLEQSSSETTALYKSEILRGHTIADLTGGFGVDAMAFAREFQKVYYVERNPELAEIVAHNLGVFEISNVEVIHSEAETFLKTFSTVDAIFVDPARRNQNNNRVFKLNDCEPNVVQLLPNLLNAAPKILVKTSPLLDIRATIRELKSVSEVHVVAVDNDCKEVLYLINRDLAFERIKITGVNILKEDRQVFDFSYEEEENTSAPIGPISDYLYEPNAAILKAGAFNVISGKFSVLKLHRNTHLYTSSQLVSDFPGRKFKVEAISKYDKKEVYQLLKASKANISIRNFPEPVQQIRKKLGLQDGGDLYLFATTDQNNKRVIIITRKV
jgi:16S rRNA G966 N2-methylase RsmD